MVRTLSDIAGDFGIDKSDVADKVVPVVSNGDINAFNGVVIGDIDSNGLRVKANTSGTYRANCYLVMP